MIIQKEALLQEAASLFETNETNTFSIRPVWIGAIAAILALIALLFLPKNNGQEDYHSYFEPYPNVFTLRSGNTPLAVRMQAYSSGDYDKAINLLNGLPIKNDTIRFYLGVSYFAMQEFELSKSSFNEITEESIFVPQKRWYSGLLGLITKDMDYGFKKPEQDPTQGL